MSEGIAKRIICTLEVKASFDEAGAVSVSRELWLRLPNPGATFTSRDVVVGPSWQAQMRDRGFTEREIQAAGKLIAACSEAGK